MTPPSTRSSASSVSTWGGKRAGAGRPPKAGRPGVSHLRRPALSSKHPVHVTLRVQRGVPSLRRRTLAGVVFGAFAAAVKKRKARVVHFSIQGNHLHLIVEAQGRDALSLAMQGLGIRLAKRLNLELRRRGSVFADRYHARALETPLEVRRAVRYVLNNYRRHLAQRGESAPADWVDPLSSAAHGRAFSRLPNGRIPCAEFAFETGPPVTPARTWLLSVGWRRHGLIRASEMPGESVAPPRWPSSSR